MRPRQVILISVKLKDRRRVDVCNVAFVWLMTSVLKRGDAAVISLLHSHSFCFPGRWNRDKKLRPLCEQAWRRIAFSCSRLYISLNGMRYNCLTALSSLTAFRSNFTSLE